MSISASPGSKNYLAPCKDHKFIIPTETAKTQEETTKTPEEIKKPIVHSVSILPRNLKTRYSIEKRP